MDSTRTKTEANEAVDDPDRLARLVLSKRHTHRTGAHTLIYWRQDWLRWDGAGLVGYPKVGPAVMVVSLE